MQQQGLSRSTPPRWPAAGAGYGHRCRHARHRGAAGRQPVRRDRGRHPGGGRGRCAPPTSSPARSWCRRQREASSPNIAANRVPVAGSVRYDDPAVGPFVRGSCQLGYQPGRTRCVTASKQSVRQQLERAATRVAAALVWVRKRRLPVRVGVRPARIRAEALLVAKARRNVRCAHPSAAPEALGDSEAAAAACRGGTPAGSPRNRPVHAAW